LIVIGKGASRQLESVEEPPLDIFGKEEKAKKSRYLPPSELNKWFDPTGVKGKELRFDTRQKDCLDRSKVTPSPLASG